MRTHSVASGNHRLAWPHLVCGAGLVVWLDDGVASTVLIAVPSALKVGMLALWLGISLLRSSQFAGALIVRAWPLVMLLLVTTLYGSAIGQWRQYSQGLGYLLIAFAMFCFYSIDRFRDERIVLLAVMITDLAATGVKTFLALQGDPLLARYLATTVENRTAVYGSQDFSGLGGYPYAYSLGSVIVLLLYFVTRQRKKGAILLALLAGVVLLVQMAFTTSIVLVSAIGLFFLVQDLVRSPALRVVLYAAAVVGWASGFYAVMLAWLAELPGLSTAVSVRLLEMSGYFAGDVSAGTDLGVRSGHWSDSIQLLPANGLFGLAGRSETGLDTGAHSQWLDLAASYGVWALLMGVFLARCWSLVRLSLSEPARTAMGRAWVYFLALGFVNPILYSTIVLTWMFLLPSLAEWLGERRIDHQTAPSAPVAIA